MKRLESVRDCYLALTEALDVVKAVQAFGLRGGDDVLGRDGGQHDAAMRRLAEARASLDAALSCVTRAVQS